MRTTDGIISSMTLDAKTTVFAASRCEATSLAVFMNRVSNPVDTRIVADSNVAGINKDNLEIFICGVLVHPV